MLLEEFQPLKTARSLFLVLLVAASSAFATASSADPLRIVALGDSLMAGYQLPAGESVPDRLEEALRARGHEVEIANAGVSGDTTSGGLSRLDWSVPPEADLVIVELGANDMLRGITPEATEKNLSEIIDRLKERGPDSAPDGNVCSAKSRRRLPEAVQCDLSTSGGGEGRGTDALLHGRRGRRT